MGLCLGKILEDSKYISSSICDSLVESNIQISQDGLFELPSHKLSWFKELLKLKKYAVTFFCLLREENATD